MAKLIQLDFFYPAVPSASDPDSLIVLQSLQAILPPGVPSSVRYVSSAHRVKQTISAEVVFFDHIVGQVEISIGDRSTPLTVCWHDLGIPGTAITWNGSTWERIASSLGDR